MTNADKRLPIVLLDGSSTARLPEDAEAGVGVCGSELSLAIFTFNDSRVFDTNLVFYHYGSTVARSMPNQKYPIPPSTPLFFCAVMSPSD